MFEIDDKIINESPYIGFGMDGFCFTAIFMPESFDFQDDNEEPTFGLMYFDGFESVEELDEFRKSVMNIEISQIERRHDVLVFKDLTSLNIIINQLSYLRDSIVKKLEENLDNA